MSTIWPKTPDHHNPCNLNVHQENFALFFFIYDILTGCNKILNKILSYALVPLLQLPERDYKLN